MMDLSTSSRDGRCRNRYRRYANMLLHKRSYQTPKISECFHHKRVYECRSRCMAKSRRVSSNSSSSSPSSGKANRYTSRGTYGNARRPYCRHCHKRNDLRRKRSRSQEEIYYSNQQPCRKRYKGDDNYLFRHHCKSCGSFSKVRKLYLHDDHCPCDMICKVKHRRLFSKCSKRKCRDCCRSCCCRHFSITDRDFRGMLKEDGKVGSSDAFHCVEASSHLLNADIDGRYKRKKNTRQKEALNEDEKSWVAYADVPDTVENRCKQQSLLKKRTEEITPVSLRSEQPDAAGLESDWLKLSLKLSNPSFQTVEGIQKEDFKLAFPGDHVFQMSDGKRLLDLNIALQECEKGKQQSISTHWTEQHQLFSGTEVVVQSAPTSEYHAMTGHGGNQTESSLYAGPSKPQCLSSVKEIEVFGHKIVVNHRISSAGEQFPFVSLAPDGGSSSSFLHPHPEVEHLCYDKGGKVDDATEHPLALASQLNVIILDDSEDEHSMEKFFGDSGKVKCLKEPAIMENLTCRKGEELNFINCQQALIDQQVDMLIQTTGLVEERKEYSNDLYLCNSYTECLKKQEDGAMSIPSCAGGVENLLTGCEMLEMLSERSNIDTQFRKHELESFVPERDCELNISYCKHIQSGEVPMQSGKVSHGFGTPTLGFMSRKKRMAHKCFPSQQQSDQRVDELLACSTVNDGQVALQKVLSRKIILDKPRLFDAGISCDLCRQGPSLSLGEWYAWCCGARLFNCRCSAQNQRKLKSLLMKPKRNHKTRKHEDISWSGKVHRMCALWSSEVFEKDDGGDHLHGVFDAVRRGRSLVCAAVGCREYGATLGCRVKSCRRSFHYACADKLASQLRCRMWDGVQFPVACQRHRHVAVPCQHAKEKLHSAQKLLVKSWKQKQAIAFGKESIAQQQAIVDCGNLTVRAALSATQESISLASKGKRNDADLRDTGIINLSSDGDDVKEEQRLASDEYKTEDASCIVGSTAKCYDEQDAVLTAEPCIPQSITRAAEEKKLCSYLGNNLLCEDISCGREAVMIPCTNDVDDDPIPAIEYITENRCLGKAKAILDTLLLDGNNLAKNCEGCNAIEMDDPDAAMSVHVWVKNGRRDNDNRFDWQGQPMLGRLPYDRYGHLLLGPDTNDVIECNSRCPCGSRCLNNELQKGLKVSVEVFKTKDRGWGIRTVEQIPRGKFVAEYVGEVLTAEEADERGAHYDMKNFSCLFSADHPEVPVHDLLIVDGYKMSNVARFVNHSCEGNLRVYRIYTEITDLRFCRIGMYAACDIEIGEELCYDYKYSNNIDAADASRNPAAIRCYCGAKTCRQWLWTGGS